MIRALIAAKPDLTIDELQRQLIEAGVRTIRSPLGRCLLRLGLTRKKRPAMPRSRTGPTSPRPAKPGGPVSLASVRGDLSSYETWASTNMTRFRGRAPRGERLVCAVPHGHWKTSTLIAAISLEGIVAPYILDGPIDGETFRAYVEQILAPVLLPGDLVVMDNLSSHKVRGVREAIDATGAELAYLPPYSPDLNPIENLFSKIKTFLRSRAEWPAAGSVDTALS